METTIMSDNLTILIENSIDSKRKKVLKKMFVVMRFVEKSELTSEQKDELKKELQEYPFSEIGRISTGQLKKKFKKLQHFVSEKFGLFIGAQFGQMKDKEAEKENLVYYIR